jgi:hypothetical protein
MMEIPFTARHVTPGSISIASTLIIEKRPSARILLILVQNANRDLSIVRRLSSVPFASKTERWETSVLTKGRSDLPPKTTRRDQSLPIYQQMATLAPKRMEDTTTPAINTPR